VVSTFSYSGRSVARQQLLATSLCLDNTAPLGVGHFLAPDLFLVKSGFGGLNDTKKKSKIKDTPCGVKPKTAVPLEKFID
jgi:hypothetical protein